MHDYRQCIKRNRQSVKPGIGHFGADEPLVLREFDLIDGFGQPLAPEDTSGAPRHIGEEIIQDIYQTTGITATAGIGTNLYLCKVAMDIVAKHMEPNEFGVRIAGLDEMTYRKLLWNHKPITDFWRIGKGIANRLAKNFIFTMGDIARCSIGKPDDYYNEDSEKKNVAEVILAKHRGGSTGTVDLAWLPSYTKFANLERRYFEEP